MKDDALKYLGLARKVGLLAVGEEAAGNTMAAGKGKLLVLGSDASPNAQRRAETFCFGHRAPRMTLPWKKEELSRQLGKPGCSMLCFTDLALADQFAAALAEELPEWKDTAELLAQRREKALRRKAAPRKHPIGKRRI